MTTTIIFDLGSVVLTGDWLNVPNFQEKLSAHYGIQAENITPATEEYWPRFNTGKITEDEFIMKFLDRAGARNHDIRFAKREWRKHHHFIEGMRALVEKLGKRYRVAALSNIPREFFDFKRERFKLDSLFGVIVASGYEGIEKPDPGIYRLLLERLGCGPKECLFIDDVKENLYPAENIGIKTVLFRGQRDLENRLIKMGIEL